MTPAFVCVSLYNWVIDVDEKLRQTYLYDFYGELLNEHQRRIYEDFVFDDLSLGEIAAERGISRQGVSDMIKRCSKKLADYENKLHLVKKFLSVKQDVEKIHSLSGEFNQSGDGKLMQQIEEVTNRILEEL